MFQSVILAYRRWSALSGLPRKANEGSYLYFDYRESYSRATDRVIIYMSDDMYLVTYQDVNPLDNVNSQQTRQVPYELLAPLFQWMQNRLADSAQLLRRECRPDPISLQLFAFAHQTNWRCSICIDDIKCNMSLLPIRSELINQIKAVLSTSEPQWES